MIVYVETNFLVELIRTQEEHESCREILDLAERGEIDARIPAFCHVEVGTVITNLRRQYSVLINDVDQKVKDFGRSEAARGLVDDVRRSRMALSFIMDDESDGLWLVRKLAHKALVTLPLDNAAISRNERLEEMQLLPDKPGDRIVLAIISADMSRHRRKSLFLTRDRDFGIEGVQLYLRRLNCKTFFSYRAALAFLQRRS